MIDNPKQIHANKEISMVARKSEHDDSDRDSRSYLLRDIPDDLWRKYKSKCAANGLSIRQWLISAIAQYSADQNDTAEKDTGRLQKKACR